MQLRSAGKPTIWIGMPPMEAPSYNKAIAGINELQKLAVFSGGAEFLDITERFLNEEGKYSCAAWNAGARRRCRQAHRACFATLKGPERRCKLLGRVRLIRCERCAPSRVG